MTMRLKAITIKLKPEEYARVVRLARARKATQSEIVRQAIALLEDAPKGRFLDLAGDAIGRENGGPTDLSTNPAWMDDYGR